MSDRDRHGRPIDGRNLDRQNRRRQSDGEGRDRRCERIRVLTVPVAEMRLISLVECSFVPIRHLEVVVVMVTVIVVRVLVVMEVFPILVNVRNRAARVRMEVDGRSRQRVCCQEEREGWEPEALSREPEESHARAARRATITDRSRQRQAASQDLAISEYRRRHRSGFSGCVRCR